MRNIAFTVGFLAVILLSYPIQSLAAGEACTLITQGGPWPVREPLRHGIRHMDAIGLRRLNAAQHVVQRTLDPVTTVVEVEDEARSTGFHVHGRYPRVPSGGMCHGVDSVRVTGCSDSFDDG